MSLNDLSCAVISCAVLVTVTRHMAVARDKGRKLDPLSEEFEILASISPMTGADLQRLPEGQRAEGTVLIITPEKLLTVDASECRIADRVNYLGIDYQVSQVNDWSDLGNFYEVIGTRLQR